MQDVNEVAHLEVSQGVAVITIDSPPVNALGLKVREGLDAAFRASIADSAVQGIVLVCAGRTFFAGADISEFGRPIAAPDLRAVQMVMENSPKPVVAAIHGTALGGGLEIALTCSHRIAVPSAKVGLPEVSLGLLPGAGGTQRLPRIVGVEAALDIMTGGKPINAAKALELGLIDKVAREDALLDDAIAFLRQIMASRQPLVRVRDRNHKIEEARAMPGLFDAFRARNPRMFKGFKAPAKIVEAVEAAVALSFDEGMDRELALFRELIVGTESLAQRYAFFAERQAGKIPDIPTDTTALAVRQVGIIGAGTMGGGIAMTFLNIGLPVTIIDQDQDALDHGVALIRKNYAASVKKGSVSQEALEKRMALITPTLNYNALAAADLIVEAAFERLDVKQAIFEKIDAIAKPGAILASNTSFLNLDAIAAVTRRPESVVGMHYFSPANVMRLLEIIRGDKTDKAVIATVMAIGRKTGKVPVLSRVCPGFIANRVMKRRSQAADALIADGVFPWDVDRVMTDFGFPMGHFAMMDLVGLDVVGWDARNSNSSTVTEILCEQGRWGQKRGAGFYDYGDDRKPVRSQVVERIILEFAERQGVQRRSISDKDILDRLLFPVVNEGAKLLEEAIALRASDIDVALIMGYGWPVYTGGPMFWADTVGLQRVINGLESLDPANVSPLLKRIAGESGTLRTYNPDAGQLPVSREQVA